MIQIRPHISDYAQSMARIVNIESADDVIAYVRCFFPAKKAQPEEFAQRLFGRDQRNGWQSWLITVRSSPVLWADAPIPGLPQLPSVAEVGKPDAVFAGPVVAHQNTLPRLGRPNGAAQVVAPLQRPRAREHD